MTLAVRSISVFSIFYVRCGVHKIYAGGHGQGYGGEDDNLFHGLVLEVDGDVFGGESCLGEDGDEHLAGVGLGGVDDAHAGYGGENHLASLTLELAYLGVGEARAEYASKFFYFVVGYFRRYELGFGLGVG